MLDNICLITGSGVRCIRIYKRILVGSIGYITDLEVLALFRRSDRISLIKCNGNRLSICICGYGVIRTEDQILPCVAVDQLNILNLNSLAVHNTVRNGRKGIYNLIRSKAKTAVIVNTVLILYLNTVGNLELIAYSDIIQGAVFRDVLFCDFPIRCSLSRYCTCLNLEHLSRIIFTDLSLELEAFVKIQNKIVRSNQRSRLHDDCQSVGCVHLQRALQRNDIPNTARSRKRFYRNVFHTTNTEISFRIFRQLDILRQCKHQLRANILRSVVRCIVLKYVLERFTGQ